MRAGGAGRPAASAVVGGGGVSKWRRIPWAARGYTFLVVVGAVGAAGWATVTAAPGWHGVGLLAILTVGGIAGAEIGRQAESGRVSRDRTHKGLSAWPFAAALLLAPGLAGWVVLPIYVHTRLRGVKIALWKWTFSGATVTLAALAGGRVFRVIAGSSLPALGSFRSLGALAAAGGAFLGVEALLFFVISRLNSKSDEVLLRSRLAGWDFYATELAVLASGAVSAVLCRNWIGYLVLAVPAGLLQQRAVLYKPLKHEIRHDPKTNLLTNQAWRTKAIAALESARRAEHPLALLFLDLDHFKNVNDTFGHLVGDEVLVATAETLVRRTRDVDLVGRFGGEEFCVLLPGIDRNEAVRVAERIRLDIAGLRFSARGLQVTTSIGIATAEPGEEGLTIDDLTARADQALYQAKNAGRDRVSS